MKAKLEKIKEALEAAAVLAIVDNDAMALADLPKFEEALTLTQELIDGLDSEELVEKVAEAVWGKSLLHGDIGWTEATLLEKTDGYLNAKKLVANAREQATAAINAIKEM